MHRTDGGRQWLSLSTRQKNANLFVVEADESNRKSIPQLAAFHGTEIQTCCLKWYEMDKLSQLRQMVL